ncbi:MAG: DUF3575 domain-containing protein [Bacteroidia bacterium]
MKTFVLFVFLFLIGLFSVMGQSGTVKIKKKEPEEKKQKCFILKTEIGLPVYCQITNKRYHSTQFFHEREGGSLTAEIGFSNRHSIQLTATDEYDLSHDRRHFLNFRYFYVIPEYKYYWNSKKAFNGFYSGIFLQEKFFRIQEQDLGRFDHCEYWLGGGLTTGYQTYIKNRLVLDCLFGTGMSFLHDAKYIYPSGAKYNPPTRRRDIVRFMLNVGYRF